MSPAKSPAPCSPASQGPGDLEVGQEDWKQKAGDCSAGPPGVKGSRSFEILLLPEGRETFERFGLKRLPTWSQCWRVHANAPAGMGRQSKWRGGLFRGISESSDLLFDASEGRYKAFLVEEESEYCDQVSRYIHLNPACIPSLRDVALAVRQRTLHDCPWSSYAAVIGLGRCPRWLDPRAVKNNEARQVLLYLAATYCRGKYTLMELGERLGRITVSGLGSARQIMARRLRESRTLRDRVMAIEARIADAKSKSDD